MSASGPVRGSVWLRLALALAALAAVAWEVRARGAGLRLGAFRWPWLLPAAALAPVAVGLRAWKWRNLAATQAPATALQSLRSYLGGLPFALLTPGRAGELARCLYFPQARLRRMQGAGLVLVDNYCDFLAVAAWSAAGLAGSLGPGRLALAASAWALLAPVSAWSQLARAGLRRLPPWWGLRRALWRLVPAPTRLPTRTVAVTVALSAAAFGIEWCQCRCLFLGAGASAAPFAAVAGVMAVANLANSLPFTPGGLGVREGVAVWLCRRHGLDPAAALAASLGAFALNQGLPALIGAGLKPAGRRKAGAEARARGAAASPPGAAARGSA